MAGYLLSYGLGHEVLALAEPHHVDVVLREQPDGRRLGVEPGIAGEGVGAVTVDVDFIEIAAE
jgi:hypothetical protein